MPLASRRERRLWAATAAYSVLIWSTAYGAQFALDFLRARNLLRFSLALVFAASASIVAALAVRRRAGPAELGVLAGAAAVYVAILASLDVVQERLHLVQYGVLGALALAAFAARWRESPGWRGTARGQGAAATGLALLTGWMDEIVQGILPNRQYDHRDVVLNLVAGALAITTILFAATARRRDAAARTPPAAG